MADFKKFQETVRSKGVSSLLFHSVNGEEVYLSTGVREAFLGDPDREQALIAVVTRFQNGDYGTAAQHGKESKPGHEYGRYEVASFDETHEDTGVWVHKTEQAIKVYFGFER